MTENQSQSVCVQLGFKLSYCKQHETEGNNLAGIIIVGSLGGSTYLTCISSRNNIDSTNLLSINPPRLLQLSMNLAGFGRDLGFAETSSP